MKKVYKFSGRFRVKEIYSVEFVSNEGKLIEIPIHVTRGIIDNLNWKDRDLMEISIKKRPSKR